MEGANDVACVFASLSEGGVVGVEEDEEVVVAEKAGVPPPVSEDADVCVILTEGDRRESRSL